MGKSLIFLTNTSKNGRELLLSHSTLKFIEGTKLFNLLKNSSKLVRESGQKEKNVIYISEPN